MPQSSGSSPSPMARRSAMTFSTRGWSLKFAGTSVTLRASAFSVFSGTAVSARVGPVLAEERRPVDRERRLVVGEDGRVGVQSLVHRRAVGADHRLGLLGRDHALGDQAPRVQRARARMLANRLVHQRLRDHRLVGLVVALAAEADQVDEHVAVEFLPVLDRDLDRQQAASGSSPLTWKIGASTIFATSVQ